MIVRDFGHFDAPIILFGGICSNLHAFQALQKAAGTRAAIALGDLVGDLGPTPETLAAFRGCGWNAIAGDHERALAERALGTDDALSDSDRAWLAGLPDIGIFVQLGRRYVVIHGAALDHACNLWVTSDQADFEAEIARIEARVGAFDGVIAAKSGIAFHRVIAGKQWIDVGSAGIPPNDGRPETRFAILTEGDVVLHRLSYDHHAATQWLQSQGAPTWMSTLLSKGLWRDEEKLPIELRR